METRILRCDGLETNEYQTLKFRTFQYDKFIKVTAGQPSIGVCRSDDHYLHVKSFTLVIEESDGVISCIPAIVIKTVDNGQNLYFSVDIRHRNVVLKTEEQFNSQPDTCYFCLHDQRSGACLIESALYPGYYFKINSNRLIVGRNNSTEILPEYLFQRYPVNDNNNIPLEFGDGLDLSNTSADGLGDIEYNDTEVHGGDYIDGMCTCTISSEELKFTSPF